MLRRFQSAGGLAVPELCAPSATTHRLPEAAFPATARAAGVVAPAWSGAWRRLAQWLAAPPNALLLLIVLGTACRLAFARMMGLGVDESYMVAAGRQLQLGYFDHPPLSWWITWGAAKLFGSELGLVVRLPFIALFAVSTWLMYQLGKALFSARAGLWAAVVFNCAPVFGVTTASWVLPDGPLDCAMLGATLCFARAMSSGQWRWWLGFGICGGLALLSKYTALLGLAGAGLYLLTQPDHRRWLLRPEPYAAALVALILFSPVLIWNAQHEWISFAFQGGRAGGTRLHPIAPFVTLFGEALFLLPWIWLPLVLVLLQAMRSGPRKPNEWLLCCLGALPIVFFSLVALWAKDRVAFHWAAPGYLLLFPLLGRAVAARLARGERLVRFWIAGSALLIVATFFIVASEVRWNWLPEVGEQFAAGRDPDLAAVDWTSVRKQMADRRLLGPDTPVVATTRWYDAGKLDYALRGTVPVICLCSDPREYGLAANARQFRGRDVLIVAPRMQPSEVVARFGPLFASIEELPTLTLVHGGREAMTIPLFRGVDLRLPPD
ncbi:MAG TPA: glycosyltransferase family 39 protein [Stellaceae bacterium]|nr:glycosyltransferase family 39 protein [Stellaceae bacterium]